jgi:hypothetical protein
MIVVERLTPVEARLRFHLTDRGRQAPQSADGDPADSRIPSAPRRRSVSSAISAARRRTPACFASLDDCRFQGMNLGITKQ